MDACPLQRRRFADEAVDACDKTRADVEIVLPRDKVFHSIADEYAGGGQQRIWRAEVCVSHLENRTFAVVTYLRRRGKGLVPFRLVIPVAIFLHALASCDLRNVGFRSIFGPGETLWNSESGFLKFLRATAFA